MEYKRAAEFDAAAKETRMTTTGWRGSRRRAALAVCAAVGLFAGSMGAQDRLQTMPGYAQYQKTRDDIAGAVTLASPSAAWKDAATVDYQKNGKTFQYDLARKAATETGPAPESARGQRAQGGAPERGRQVTTTLSPDGRLKASYRARNLWLSDADGGGELAVTTDGSDAPDKRIKYGTASWVYGEELEQTTAMWWSPDSARLAYYRFDELKVDDYYLQIDQTKLYSRIDTEAYPKAGRPNPIVDLFVYDVAAKKSTRIDVRDGKRFDNSVVGHYVYKVAWSPDGTELLFNRTNRRQNVLELVAANPVTGACRVIIHEEWPTGWIENSPGMVFLEDGRRFIWESERNGWKNFYLYDLSGKLLHPLTTHSGFEVQSLVKVDEDAKVVFYTARDGDNHLKTQLHRVGLDGKGDVRLTDPAFNHSIGGCLPRAAGARGAGGGAGAPRACGIAPDNRHFIDFYQTHDLPPATRIVDGSGTIVAELNASDLTRFTALGLRKAEMFTYKAADGRTTLRGLISFPSNFDPSKKYPALVSVYGGPASASDTARETFVRPNPLAEYRLPDPEPRLARGARHGQAHARFDLPEARAGGDGRHG